MLFNQGPHLGSRVIPDLVDDQDVRIHGVEQTVLGCFGGTAVEQAVALHVPGGQTDVGGILAGQRKTRRGDRAGGEGVGDAAGAGRHVGRVGVAKDEPEVAPVEQALPAGRDGVTLEGHLEIRVADRGAHLQANVILVDGVGAPVLEGALSPAELPHQFGADAVEKGSRARVHVGVDVEPHVLLLVGLDLALGLEAEIEIILIVGHPDTAEVHGAGVIVGIVMDRGQGVPVLEVAVDLDGRQVGAGQSRGQQGDPGCDKKPGRERHGRSFP